MAHLQELLQWKDVEVIDPSVNEVYLWHGCPHGTAQRIAREGFDERTASLEGLYGSGSYFAAQACKALQYASADGCSRSHRLCRPRGRVCECCDGRERSECPRRRRLLYCRVLLGDPYC